MGKVWEGLGTTWFMWKELWGFSFFSMRPQSPELVGIGGSVCGLPYMNPRSLRAVLVTAPGMNDLPSIPPTDPVRVLLF